MRPRRSVLYVPGANARALEKARTLPCDGLILDLEDSVSPEQKPAARDAVIAALAKGYAPREVAVRINGRGTDWYADDIAALARSGADALVVPKCDDAETMAETDWRLTEAGAPDAMTLWCMIETPAGVLDAREIVTASPRMGALLLGAADLTKALGARDVPGRPALATAIGLVILAARAAGIAVLDSPFFDLADDEGFARACREGRTLGFDGKTLIHPKTIDAANAAYGPDPDEVAEARRIVAAYEAAAAKGQGVTLLDGKLVEGLHAEESRRLIALADEIAKRG